MIRLEQRMLGGSLPGAHPHQSCRSFVIHPGQRQLDPRADAELGLDAVQVQLDRAVGDAEAMGDLLGLQTGGGEGCNLVFARGQLVHAASCNACHSPFRWRSSHSTTELPQMTEEAAERPYASLRT
jgi:hypothetical protein